MYTLRRTIETLHPAYFDVVMATGVLAVAAQLEQMRPLALALTYLNIAVFMILASGNVARLLWFRTSFLKDLADFERGPGFFTMVAGFAILGSQIAVILNRPALALGMWIAAELLWLFLNYAIFVEVTVNENKPRFEKGINGVWLVSVVATQSVANLAAQLSDRSEHASEILFLALIMWLAGGMLYIWLIVLIFYRFTFFAFKPEHFMPPFWINMGAMAISALTGTTLAARAENAKFLADLLPFVKGLTILFWATATWWIPMLILLACWQPPFQEWEPAIQLALLERSISLGYVYGLQLPACAINGSVFPAVDSPSVRIHRLDQLGGDTRRHDPRRAWQLSATGTFRQA